MKQENENTTDQPLYGVIKDAESVRRPLFLNITESKPRRVGQEIWRQRETIYLPCSLPMKNMFAEVARLNRMSQAQMGALLVEWFLESPLWLSMVVSFHSKGKDDE